MTIRKRPEDFVVEERLSAAFAAGIAATRRPDDRCAVFELRKRSLTTQTALRGLARALGVRDDDVDCAGLKDRHAATVQHATVLLERLADPDRLAAHADDPITSGGPARAADEGAADEVDEEGARWSARFLGWCGAPITGEAIDGNSFTIVLRDCASETCADMDRRARLLADDGVLFVANYFGAQRFGSARHGRGFAAKHLVAGDAETALKLLLATPSREDHGAARTLHRVAEKHWGQWPEIVKALPRIPERAVFERLARGGSMLEGFAALPSFTQRMCIEAWQSHLWNDAVRRFLERTAKGPLLRSDDRFGPFLFPRARDLHPLLRKTLIGLPAPDTELQQPWREDLLAAVAAEGATLEALRVPDLGRPRFSNAKRSLFMRIERWRLEEPVPDETSSDRRRLARTLRLDLPRGSYATVVLRALGQ